MALAVVIRDEFSGSDTGSSLSGDAPFSTVDGSTSRLQVLNTASPSTGDQYDYVTHFPTGDITVRLIYTSPTVAEFRRISTITGDTFDVLIATLSGGTLPTTPGQIIGASLKITRGAANNSTAFEVRGPTTSANLSTFSTAGEQTPTGAEYLIVGTSIVHFDDVSGRVPDGGGDAGLVAGHWEVSFQVQPYEHLGILGGRLVTLPGAFDSLFYRLADHGLTTADYAVHGVYYRDFEPTESFPFAYSYVGLRTDEFGNGYWMEIADFGDDPDDGGYYLSIYSVTGSTSIQGDGSSFTYISGPDFYSGAGEALGDGPTDIVISAVGTSISANLNAGFKTVTVTDTDHSSVGDPGVGATSGDTTLNNEIQFDLWEVLAEGVTLEPCGNLWSAHDFIGVLADVDGEITDTLPGVGTWLAHPDSGAALANNNLSGNILGAGRAVYLDDSITDLPPDYCVNVIASYPQVIGADPGNPGSAGTPRPLIWEDDFSGSGGLDGRVNDGATWEQVLGETSQNGPDAVVDGGMVYLPSASTQDASSSLFRITGLTLPADIDVEIDVYCYSQEYGVVGVDVRHNSPAPSLVQSFDWNYHWWLLQNQSLTDKRNLYHAGVGSDPNGGLGTPNILGPPGQTTTIETRVRGIGSAPAFITVYWGGTSEVPGACGPTGVPEISFFDGQFGLPRNNFNSGDVCLLLGAQRPDLGPSPLRVKAIRIYGVLPGVDPCSPGYPGGTHDVGEVASTELLARYDAATDSGIVLRQTFDHSAAGVPQITYALEERTAGVPTLCRSDTRDGAHDAAYRLRLQPHGTVIYTEVNGEELWTFDLATDVADETSATVTDHPTGAPGLGGTDASGTGAYLRLAEYRVYAEEDPCTGGPENPYPPNPPPVEPPVPYIYRMTNALWESIVAPLDGVPGGVVPITHAIPEIVGDLRVRNRTIWEALGVSEVQPPPPNTPLPPYHDPCGLLDPGVDLPPIGDVTPIPSVAGRSFGMGPMPVTLFGDVLNASQRPIGSWTRAELAICVSRGATIFGGTGGYLQFVGPDGYYSQALMDAWILRLSSLYGDDMMTGQANGSFGGMITLDDFRVQRLWPTSLATGGGNGAGLSAEEVDRICNLWHFYLPDLVVGVRIAPTRISRPFDSCTLYVAQYDGPRTSLGKSVGDTITVADFRGYRDRELARAVSFGPNVVVNLQPNFLHGGSIAGYNVADEWPQPYITPAELLLVTEGWYGDGGGANVGRIYSSTGFMYRPEYVAVTGMWDALADMHNGVMSLPPL